ncbi:MAG: hypothetical protein ABIZ49_07240 [Opitutaceae bacterium]
MKTVFSSSLILGAALLLSLSLRAEATLVTRPSLEGQSLDREGSKAVLLGKRVPIGDPRVVVIISEAGEAQENFLKARYGRVRRPGALTLLGLRRVCALLTL